jgi:hypothetical protein
MTTQSHSIFDGEIQMAEKKNHIASLLIPADWHQWVLKFADKYNVPHAILGVLISQI